MSMEVMETYEAPAESETKTQSVEPVSVHPTISLLAEHAHEVARRSIAATDSLRPDPAKSGEDYFQNVCLTLVENPDKFSGDENDLRSFVYRASINSAISAYRRRKRLKQNVMDASATGRLTPATTDFGKDDESNMLEAVVSAFMGHYADSGRQIKAFVATQVSGLTYEQVSQQHGVPVTTTRKDVYFARQKLKRMFPKKWDLLRALDEFDGISEFA
jgi:RNA polymerase sigma factor (sigma-70 family)